MSDGPTFTFTLAELDQLATKWRDPGTQLLIDTNKRLFAEVAELLAEAEHMHDMTCTCGSYRDHRAWEGHTPVSTYDHALEKAGEENERREMQVTLMQRTIKRMEAQYLELWAENERLRAELVTE